MKEIKVDEMMNYHILTEGNRIASFGNAIDRDCCLAAFEKAYSDCDFTVDETTEDTD